MLPDPAAHPVEYLAAAFGLPDWLVRRWLPRYGVEECQRLGFWFAGPAPLTLRCNPLRIGARYICWRRCVKPAMPPKPGEHPQAMRLHEAGPIRDLPGYDRGLVQRAGRVGDARRLGAVPGAGRDRPRSVPLRAARRRTWPS